MANDTAKTLTIGGVTYPIEDEIARQTLLNIVSQVGSLRNALDAMTNSDTTTAIETFQEVIDFLSGVTDSDTLVGKLNELRTLINGKYTKPASGIPATDIADGVIPDTSNLATKTELGDKVDKVNGKGLSTNDYTTDEKTKLAGIAAGAEVNVQPDWNQTNSSSDDFIKNKPSLANVATSGSYNDLNDKPTIPTALSGLSEDSTHRTVTDAEKATWGGKQNALTFDSTPTANSTNPVTSGGVKTYVGEKTSTPIVSLTPTNNIAALDASKYYLLGSVGSSTASSNVLTLSFTTSQTEALSYMGRFTAVADALSLSLPSGIHFNNDVPDIKANHTYEFNILYDTCLLTDITYTDPNSLNK